MKTSFKKLVAWASIMSLIAMNALSVNGANIQATAVASWNTISSTIVLTSALNFPAVDEIVSASIKNLDWTTAWTTTLTTSVDWSDDTSTLTIATADLTNNAAYIVSFVTTSWNAWAVMVNVWTPTNNVVTVSASVLPTLSMSITNPAINIWDLSTVWTTQAATTSVVSVSSNANSFSVLANIAWTDTSGNIANKLVRSTDNNDIDAQIDFWLNTDGLNAINITNNQEVINQITFTSAPVTAEVRYVAWSAAWKKAWNYSANVTYTVTWSF